MKKRDFERLLEGLRRLTGKQLVRLSETVGELHSRREVQNMAEARLERQGTCPHCSGPNFSRWGHTNAGEQRYRCSSDGCRKTFTGLTGTPFGHIHGKAILLENASCMKSFMSVRDVADELGIHRNTAFRYRHLMMPLLEKHQPAELPADDVARIKARKRHSAPGAQAW
jgi:transposase-like protein